MATKNQKPIKCSYNVDDWVYSKPYMIQVTKVSAKMVAYEIIDELNDFSEGKIVFEGALPIATFVKYADEIGNGLDVTKTPLFPKHKLNRKE